MFGMWKQINFANGPEERADHGMCVSDDGNRIFVFGGQTPRKAFNDLWQFTISTNTWELLPSPTSPAPRWGSTLSYVNEKLYLFGGDDVRQSDYYNLCIYHLRSCFNFRFSKIKLMIFYFILFYFYFIFFQIFRGKKVGTGCQSNWNCPTTKITSYCYCYSNTIWKGNFDLCWSRSQCSTRICRRQDFECSNTRMVQSIHS